MSTLSELENIGSLLRYDPDLDAHEMPHRYVFISPAEMRSSFDYIEIQPTDRGRNLSPIEQVESILYTFCIGGPLSYGKHARNLSPRENGVWEIKTTDVRIFGWFCARAHFVAVCMEMKKNLRVNGLYDPFIQKVVRFREELELDHPKFLNGSDLCNVL